MISPFAQTDAASLGVWVNSSPAKSPVANEAIRLAIEGAAAHDQDGLQIALWHDRSSVEWAISAALATWHEKRHVVDLLLTNYGGFLRRQFSSVQINLVNLIAEAQEAGLSELWTPFTVYDDPTSNFRLPIGAPPISLKKQARDIRAREAVLSRDSAPGDGPFGRFQVGGDAQLEAVAFLCERTACELEFGTDELIRRFEHRPESRVGRVYGWIIPVFHGFNVGTTAAPHRSGNGDQVFLDAAVALPILVGSLCGRFWGDRDAAATGALPATRLLELLKWFARRLQQPDGVDATWELVNLACRELWGRTPVEEVASDLSKEADLLERIDKAGRIRTELRANLWAAHGARRELSAVLKNHPEQIVDAREYHRTLAARVEIPVVRAYRSARVSAGETGWTPLWAKMTAHEGVLLESASYRLFAGRDVAPSDVIHVVSQEGDAWGECSRFEAPMSKLALKGRCHRVMLPMEFEGAAYFSPLQIAVDPMFAAPDPELDASEHCRVAGIERPVCDRCNDQVEPRLAFLAPAWWIRTRESVRPWLGAYIEEAGIDALLSGDWSEWLLCARCRNALEPVHEG